MNHSALSIAAGPLGALGDGFFWSTLAREEFGKRVGFLQNEVLWFNTAVSRAAEYRDKVGSTPAIEAFDNALAAARPAVQRASSIVAAGRSKLAAARTPPTAPPPDGMSLETWRLTWYIDSDQVKRVLPELNELRQSWDARQSAALVDTRQRQKANGEPVVVPDPRKLSPVPINYYPPNPIIPRSWTAGSGSRKKTAVWPWALLGSLGVAGLLYMAGKRGRR